ncbi:hypothetical protein [Ruegeria sp. HKCCA0235A]|uniref:hypothetical protein n=1 Tax=Ruegeria sp. HKCCA0235A TaxID=2682998 RepID=UPI001C2C22F6|nr:hypothetical protein [Ruegeria sp. HKCCA0235A]
MRSDPKTEKSNAAAMPRVRIHARIVPNGVARRPSSETGCALEQCDDSKLRATLLLTPQILSSNTKTEGVRLDQWPAKVHELLKGGVEGLIVTVPSGHGSGKVCDGDVRALKFTAPSIANISSERDLQALCDIWVGSLWKYDIADENGARDNVVIGADRWKLLGESIARTLGSNSVTSNGMGEDNAVETANKVPDASLYGADGQVAPSEAAGQAKTMNVVAALDIRHADLAVSLEGQRAVALAESLKAACKEAVERAPNPLKRRSSERSVKVLKDADIKNNIDEEYQELANEIIKQPPREVNETFATYCKRLSDGLPILPNLDPENFPGGRRLFLPKDVERILLTNEGLIAELRRRRRIAERTALFEDLKTDREGSVTLYNKAKNVVISDQCVTANGPEWAGTMVTPATVANGEDDFDDNTAAARYANWQQYRTKIDEDKQTQGEKVDKSLEAAQRSFFTLQSTPTLARATMLAIDLELDLNDEHKATLDEMGEYAHLSVNLNANTLGNEVESVLPRPWTLLRVTEPERENCYHFWPASREEADCRSAGQGAPAQNTARQYGGLMVMGFGSGSAADTNTPRFDITSLDIRTAMELELQRRSIEQSNVETEQEVGQQSATENRAETPGASATETKALPPGVNEASDPTDLVDEGDRQDVGLTLLDRGLCTQAIRKMAARDAKFDTDDPEAACVVEDRLAIVLDAEDLTMGYRLYVGTPGNDCTKWHPMMSRAIKFGTTGPDWRETRRIEDILSDLVGRFGSPERVALESASFNVPGRMLPKSEAPNGGGKLDTEAVFEQAVSVWDGGPMGVECSVQPGTEMTTPDTLIFGRELSIPEGNAYRLPRLRYGRPYRFALAAVYSGGRSIDEVEFPDDTGQHDTRADLYYPSERMKSTVQTCATNSEDCTSPTVQPFVRALRQAKIGAPQVLMPEGHARRLNGPMGPDQLGMMLVRSVDTDEKNPKDKRFTSRGQPATARRVILIPSIPLARAAAHMGSPDNTAGTTSRPEDPTRGVFDNLRQTPTSTGGLTFVRQQKNGGGFPAIKTSYLKGLNGTQHFSKREIEDAPADTALAEGQDLDGAIFAAGSSPKSAYYPDPAAESLVVRVRLQGGSGDWLTMVETAKPDTKEIAPIDLISGNTYPDRRRVLLTVNRRNDREQIPTALEDIMTYRGRRSFNPSHSDGTNSSGRFTARELILTLAPHEWVDVEMWLLPSAKRLARDFSVIQTLGTHLAQRGENAVASSLKAMCTGANLCLPEDILDDLIADLQRVRAGQVFFGPGGIGAPTMPALLELANAVRRCMIRHPIAEISGVSCLRAIHANNRATVAPVIVPAENTDHFKRATYSNAASLQYGPEKPLRAFRPAELAAGPRSFDELVNERKRVERENRAFGKDQPFEPISEIPHAVCIDDGAPITVAAKGSTNLILDGDVALDLNQIDTIEVRARMAFPGSTTFDDRLRGRSLALRRAGWWPLVDKPTGVPADHEGEAFRDAQSLFGFHVYPSGQIAFDRAEVTLLRAENLPRPSSNSCRRKLSLRRLFEEGDIGDVRITERHLFPDGKARRMSVWVNGLPRAGQFMRTADRQLRAGDPWVASEGLHHDVGELVAGEDLRAEAQCRLSEEIEVILPATKRPAKPDARAPLPAFRHDLPKEADKTRTKLMHHRRSIIRIPLGREWFSSGEEERLGIVLWPPQISTEDNRLIEQNKVVLRDPKTGKEVRRIDLDDLSHYRLTKRKLIDIICPAVDGADDPMPFEDSHLGPGGRFVSRRGADPVREGNHHKQILFAPGDFPDLDLEDGDPQKAELVTMVEMPLSDDEAPESNAGDRAPPMMVSLLTYQPRFDPEKETWYVDVTLEDSEAAETFVRFGLVRYQPHTRPELRCSRPVRQFVQPLPERIADISRIAPEEGNGIRVRLCGPTFYRRRISDALQAELGLKDQPENLDSWFADVGCNPPDDPRIAHMADASDMVHGAEAAPRMKVTVFREGTDPHGRAFRETVPLPVSAVGRDSHLLLPLDADTGVIGPSDFAPITRENPEARKRFFRLKEDDKFRAGSVVVKAAFVARGDGTWLLNIPKEILGDFNGLKIQVEEVEAFEPADPDTLEEQARKLVPSIVENEMVAAEEENDETTSTAGPPNVRTVGYHHSGARMRAVFDLSGWS